MATIFTTPSMSGFNARGAHPDGGIAFGGAATAEAGLLRGGKHVIREVAWHCDETRSILHAPFLVTDLRGPVKEKIGVAGKFLLTGAQVRAWGRAWPGGTAKLPYKRMPAYMDEEGVYVIDEDWSATLPLQDTRGSLRAEPLRLDENGAPDCQPRELACSVRVRGATRARHVECVARARRA
jgi:hypothetical protein